MLFLYKINSYEISYKIGSLKKLPCFGQVKVNSKILVLACFHINSALEEVFFSLIFWVFEISKSDFPMEANILMNSL